jgi:hypothetical protein
MPPTCQNDISGVDTRENDRTNLINKLHSLLPLNTPNGANLLVVEQDTIELIGVYEHFWAERGRDELCRRRKRMDHGWRAY